MQSEPTDSSHRIHSLDIAVWEWSGEEPAVVFCHATGFHARCWDRVVARLNGRRAIALDFRGHGRSSKPDPPYAWRRFGEDLAQLTRDLGIQGADAAGHSMGGHSVVLAAALNPSAFRSLLLLDPVILPRQGYRGPLAPLDFVLRRRNQWASPDEMFERFKDRPPFQSWDRAVLRDYCDYALNGSALACPPEVEASIYANCTAMEADIYPEIPNIAVPVQVVRSRSTYEYGRFDGSPTDPDLASLFQHGRDLHLSEYSHFIPMEAPALTAELILKR